jgi:hypothetical protein
MSMKKSSDTIGNQSHDLPVCSAVPSVNVFSHISLLLTCVHMPMKHVTCESYDVEDLEVLFLLTLKTHSVISTEKLFSFL